MRHKLGCNNLQWVRIYVTNIKKVHDSNKIIASMTDCNAIVVTITLSDVEVRRATQALINPSCDVHNVLLCARVTLY
jgi:hypothetical protein